MTALIRNLATMTRVGLLAPGSDGTAKVVAQLGDAERIRRARVHPIALLAALRTYASGRGVRGKHAWNPVREIVDALDAAFYAAFGNVEPAGKRLLLALDVSGSMEWGWVAGMPGLTPAGRVGGAGAGDGGDRAGATRSSASSPARAASGSAVGRRQCWLRRDGLTPLAISPRQRLDDAVKAVSDLPFGGTDCALPMLYAQAQEREIDTFVVYTDSETWAGNVHPVAGAPRLPPGVGHRRTAGRGRHGLERVHDRRPERPGDARRRRLRHRDAAADLRLRPRRALTRAIPRRLAEHARRGARVNRKRHAAGEAGGAREERRWAMPYRARINERTLLNLPGFHGGAFVYVYVEDTSERDLAREAVLRRRLLVLSCELRAAHVPRDRGLRPSRSGSCSTSTRRGAGELARTSSTRWRSRSACSATRSSRSSSRTTGASRCSSRSVSDRSIRAAAGPPTCGCGATGDAPASEAGGSRPLRVRIPPPASLPS